MKSTVSKVSRMTTRKQKYSAKRVIRARTMEGKDLSLEVPGNDIEIYEVLYKDNNETYIVRERRGSNITAYLISRK